MIDKPIYLKKDEAAYLMNADGLLEIIVAEKDSLHVVTATVKEFDSIREEVKQKLSEVGTIDFSLIRFHLLYSL